MTRISPLSPGDMTSRQKEVYEAIANGPRGRVAGPLAVWLNRPELADRSQALGRYCRYDSSLEPRLSELAILVTARVWGSEYEWAAHKPIALKAGLGSEIVEAIRTRQAPHFEKPDEAIVFEFAQRLHTERSIDEELYKRTVAEIGEEGTIDLTGILGYYTLISMTINVFDVDTPEGYQPELNESGSRSRDLR